MEKLYTCSEIAERYSVKVDTVWDWIRNGKIRVIAMGRQYRARESDLLAFEQDRLTRLNGDEATGPD